VALSYDDSTINIVVGIIIIIIMDYINFKNKLAIRDGFTDLPSAVASLKEADGHQHCAEGHRSGCGRGRLSSDSSRRWGPAVATAGKFLYF